MSFSSHIQEFYDFCLRIKYPLSTFIRFKNINKQIKVTEQCGFSSAILKCLNIFGKKVHKDIKNDTMQLTMHHDKKLHTFKTTEA